MQLTRFLFFIAVVVGNSNLQALQITAQGFFTSEAATVPIRNDNSNPMKAVRHNLGIMILPMSVKNLQ